MSWLDGERCSTGEIICPHCKHKTGYSGDPLGDDETTEEICEECDKKFIVQCQISADHICFTEDEDE